MTSDAGVFGNCTLQLFAKSSPSLPDSDFVHVTSKEIQWVCS